MYVPIRYRVHHMDTTFYVHQPIEGTRISSFFFVLMHEKNSSHPLSFSVSTTGLFSFPFSRYLSLAPIARAKSISHQTKIFAFVPCAPSAAAALLVLGVVSPEVSEVAEETPLASLDTGPDRPALSGTVDEIIDTLLLCLPPVSMTVTVVTASLGNQTFVATAASGIVAPSGIRSSTSTGRHCIVYNGPSHIETHAYHHSSPSNGAVDRNVEVSKPTIDLLG